MVSVTLHVLGSPVCTPEQIQIMFFTLIVSFDFHSPRNEYSRTSIYSKKNYQEMN